MKRLLLNQKGVVPVVLLLLITGLSIAVISAKVSPIFNPNRPKAQAAISLPTPSPTPTATPTPTPTPTSTPTPQPTVKPTLKPTTKPAAPAPPTVSGTPGNGYSRITVATERGNFTASVITLDIGAKMVTDTASENDCENDCPTLPLKDYVSRNGGFAGINGSYFCPDSYPDCQSKKNAFDFPVYNSSKRKWINQSKLFWNDRSMIYQDGSGMHFLRNANGFNGSLNAGITNYPALLDNGTVVPEQYSLSEKQVGATTKGGIGYSDSKIFLVIANANMTDFAYIFKALGAKYALNLDGGGSSALFYGGYVYGPGRNLPNAVIFK